MSVQPSIGSSEFDLRCSSACTRAAITALLLSILSLSLATTFDSAQYADALGTYLYERDNLSQYVNEIQDDKCWQSIPEGEDTPLYKSGWSMMQLLNYQCKSTSSADKGTEQAVQSRE